MTGHQVKDESADRKYFILTPQLVWALSRDTYDYTLWSVIKMIAGEKGECYLSTDDLATLSMMSTGKVSQCRSYLRAQGLLEGKIRKDPGYPQPVWHLRIPDLWRANIEWRQAIGDALRSRVEYKRLQGESLHLVKASPGEGGTSPGEGGTSPGEGGTSPGETKENQTENQEEPEEKAVQSSFYITPQGVKIEY